MGAWFSVLMVISLILIAVIGVEGIGLYGLFAVAVPYAAFICFVGGVLWRIIAWARVPVPFRIPTTCGQQRSLPWIRHNPLENPSTTPALIARMALEVLCFRSLFRNNKVEIREGPKLVYGSTKWLWMAGLAFHWSFLLILLRHLRFFTEPVLSVARFTDAIDGIFKIGVPTLYLTDMIILAAVIYLLLRRLLLRQVRYISLSQDFFPLILILGIVFSGLLMRYLYRVDIAAVKELAVGLFSFHPVIPRGIGLLFYVHFFLVSVLFGYFPFSKLMHMGGVFMSPTRNLTNNSRMKRHINPWNYPVKVHTYQEYEDEFREKMKAAGLPVEKE